MTSLFKIIRKSLAKKICAGILALVLVTFVVGLGFLAINARRLVLQEAYQHAERALDNTTLRVTGYLKEVETATHNIMWQVTANMQPDSLMSFTRRVVEINPNVNSCSITTEPGFFPEYGRYFSAYSVRQGDTIVTVREGEYEYFDKVWYKTPHDAGKAVWVDPFDDYNEGTLSSAEMIASYCVPLYDADSTFIGVLSTDISLPRLSEAVSALKPYPNAYSLMLGHDGSYFVHPDTSRLVKTTIFTDVDPKVQPDLITLGHEMIAGHKGNMKTVSEGVTYVTFYQPVPKTGWSLGLVCVERDVLAGYHHLPYIILPILVIGLLIIALFCIRIVRGFLTPIMELEQQVTHIADGNFSEQMPRSRRHDAVGRLQNHFATMQQALQEHVENLKRASNEVEQQNRELEQAQRMASEADRKQSDFIKSISHQLRTPLNIIMGFTQVMRDHHTSMTPEERHRMTDTMQQNSTSVTRMVDMLLAASYIDRHQVSLNDRVPCNDFAREMAERFNSHPPTQITISVDSQLPDTEFVITHRDYLTKALNELLYNAKKFTVKGSITLRLRQDAREVRFIVEDTGPGIPEKAIDTLFTQFSKLDDFTEGLGLGLNISRQFARILGGDLYLDRDYTSGCRFVLEVPRTKSTNGLT